MPRITVAARPCANCSVDELVAFVSLRARSEKASDPLSTPTPRTRKATIDNNRNVYLHIRAKARNHRVGQEVGKRGGLQRLRARAFEARYTAISRILWHLRSATYHNRQGVPGLMTSSNLAYHLSELECALAGPNNGMNRPILRPTEQTMLDVGGGFGQSFVAMAAQDRRCVCLDVDLEILRYGMENYGWIQYVQSRAESLPFPDHSFDLVFSRVALPYTNIPKALLEIKRVLKPGGRVWMTLHNKNRPGNMFADMKGAKKKAYRAYEWINGHCLFHLGLVFSLGGRYVSWQDNNWMCKRLEALGFVVKTETVGSLTAIEGVLQ